MNFFLFFILTFFTACSFFNPNKSKDVCTSSALFHVIRLQPNQDPYIELNNWLNKNNISAATIVSSVGSLASAAVRPANSNSTENWKGPFEVVSLVGTLSQDGPHLHISLSDSIGKTIGGHLKEGSSVFTTLEVVIAELPQMKFTREVDNVTTFKELVVNCK